MVFTVLIDSLHQLLQGVWRVPPEFLETNTPEPIVKWGQAGALGWPGPGCQPGNDPLAKLLSQPLPHLVLLGEDTTVLAL